MLHDQRIAVVIPAHNEEQAIPKVLAEIPRDIIDTVIVVDNDSTDKTGFMAREGGAMVVFEKRRGYGATCLRGLSKIPNDTDIVVILDGDYGDFPGQVRDLVAPLVRNEADFVLGSRILGRRQEGALAPQAYWGNKLAVLLIRLFFGHSFTDMGPFRAIRLESLKKLRMADQGFGWNAEMQVKAIRAGLRIKEVPVDYRRRIGVSKISGTLRGTVMAGSKIIFTIIKHRLLS